MKRAALIVAFLLEVAAFADTNVSGNIGTNTTWTLAGSPYILTSSVTVGGPAAPILTIQPGVVVKGNAGSQLLVGWSDRGALVANGTPAAPILFTANGSTTPGFWYGVRLGAVAGAPGSSISYATVEYAGSNYYGLGGITVLIASPSLDHVTSRLHQYAGIKIENSTPTITSSTVRDNAGYGIYLASGGATLSDVALIANSGMAVSAPAASQLSGMTGLSATGNGTNAVEYRAGTIAASRTWKTCALPYIVAGSIFVEHTSAPILTIEQGNTIRFNSGAQIGVNHANKGGLQANGTSSAPILFTSNGPSTPGYWLGLWFGGIAGGPQSNVSYATVEYGGSSYWGRGGITINALSPAFDHITLRNNAFAGAVLSGGSLALSNATISENGGPGVNGLGGTTLTLTSVAFTNNGGHAVTLPVSVTLADASNLTASGNGTGRDAIEYRSGTINANSIWPRSTIPYVVTGTVYVEGSLAPTLTIASGNTIRFNSGGQIAVNYNNRGALQANGTAEAPIFFTSNGSQTAGFWVGLYFGAVANAPGSSVSYATIEYGGSTYWQRGGITVNTLSVFDHVTLRTNSVAGALLNSGVVMIRNSTITANAGPGIQAGDDVVLMLNDDAFTNNAGQAVSLAASTTLSQVSNLTATGNGTGRDSIEYRAGTISDDRTWLLSPLPYVVTGSIFVEANAQSKEPPVLTIAEGNTVRFNSGAQIAVNHSNKGALQANGTATAPIVFTSNGTATAGYWLGLWFGGVADGPPSSVSWATIEYGGLDYWQRGGITVNALSPVFDHLTIRNNAFAGFVGQGNSTPRITNTWFSGNPYGVKRNSPAAVSAALNYWNVADGPCLIGSCVTGQQAVTSGVQYEPWLISTPTTQQFLTGSIVQDRAFSPAIQAYLSVEYWQALPGPSTMTIKNSSNESVRTFSGTHLGALWAWNGTNDYGVVQPDGTYTYEIASTFPSLPPAAIAKGVAIVDSTRTLTLSNPAASLAFFSPNADGVQDATIVTATTNYEGANWTVNVVNPMDTVVLTRTGNGSAISLTWAGESDGKIMQLQGLHTVRVDVSMGTATLQKTTTTTLDTIAPAASIATPAANAVLSNVYMNGGTNVVPTGSVSDVNLLNWTAQSGLGASPTQWSNIGSGTAPVSGGNLGTWAIGNGANGTYALRLVAADKAGNSTTSTTTPLVVGNFKVAQSAYQFNAGTGGAVTYTSTIPFPLTETIVVKNEAGTVVRNLLSSVARAAGAFQDAFNGRNDANVLLPDGPYFYVATVTDGIHTMTWDLSTAFRNDYTAWNDSIGIQAYDPFNNVPLQFNYTFAQPARVTIATKTTSGSVVGNCQQPSATFFCPVFERWEESGQHSFTWSGIDHTGGYRGIRSLGIVSSSANFPKNAVVMFGTKPKVENVRVTPPVFGPVVGEQTIEFDLTTYQSQAVDVSIALVNLSTLSTLRTLTLASQSPGHRTTTWDGRADNGMLVAPGFYAVAVTATDLTGNVAKSDILTTIKY